MRGIGLTLIILGAGSFVLNYFGYEFTFVSWVDNWGITTGMIIRLAMVAAGIGLLFLARSDETREEAA
jgi:hypothetical protein